MKHLLCIALAVCCLNGAAQDTPEKLGIAVLYAIAIKNEPALMKLVLTSQEAQATIDAADMPDSIRNVFKPEFMQKFNADTTKTRQKIKENFLEIAEFTDTNMCELDSARYNAITHPLKNLPFELGEVTISYPCVAGTTVIAFKAFRAGTSWRLLEKLRLVATE